LKLRIKGNSLRLRLSQSEVAGLLASAQIEEVIHFTPAEDSALTYTLRHERSESLVRLDYTPHQVDVILSTAATRAWAESEQVGIYTSLDIGVHGQLEVIVEKDFACLDRDDAENADAFPNPNASC
jgi:hypothetical protein